MFLWTTLLSSLPAWAEGPHNIGVWEFSIVGNKTNTHENQVLTTTLAERVRQEVLPLTRQHGLHLVTPENLSFEGSLPTNGRILETSKALGLDYVILGSISQGRQTNCILKLYHVDTGILLQQQSIDVTQARDLLRETPPLIDDLMLPLLHQDNQQAPNIIVNFDAEPREDTLLFIDGKVQCKTLPCAQKLRKGNHNIQFHNPYYERWNKDLYLEPSIETYAKLKPSFGQLTVVSTPPGLRFELNGVSMGATPLDKHRIEKGKHEISILDPCYMGRDQEFTIANNENEKIRLTAVPRLAGLDVYLENPTQIAKVYVDDEFLGKTPLSTQVPMCSKELRVENNDGYAVRQLSLIESEVEKYTIQLQKHRSKSKRTKSTASNNRRTSSTQSRPSRKRTHSRRFNPTHSLWSTYTVQYGLENEDWRIALGTMQIKNGNNESFIAPLLPGWRFQVLDYSVSHNPHHLFPIGVGYAFDFELGLVQPYYQWQWLSINDLSNIQHRQDLWTETTTTIGNHKIGVDFLLNHEPFKNDTHHQGGTLQLQSSYIYCSAGTSDWCQEEVYVGASLYLSSGRWGF